MNVSDDELMAYVDGELDAARRAVLDGAIAADAELARRVAGQQALREKLHRAFDGTLGEPVPQRLVDAVHGSPVVDFPARDSRTRRRPFMVMQWLAVAASLVLGILISPWIHRPGSVEPSVVAHGTSLEARGELATALSQQLASEQSPSSQIRLAVSFVADSGEYCRTFITGREGGSLAGIACREHDAWRIRTLESVANSPDEPGDYRQAATSLPPLVLQAAEASMTGQPLDAQGEAAARSRGWQKPAETRRRPRAEQAE